MVSPQFFGSVQRVDLQRLWRGAIRSVWIVLRGKLNQRLLENNVDDRPGGVRFCSAALFPT